MKVKQYIAKRYGLGTVKRNPGARQTDDELFCEVIDQVNAMFGPVLDYNGKPLGIPVDDWPKR